MRLAYAFLADAAEVVNGRFFVFGGGVELVHSIAVPTALPSLAIVIKLRLDEGDIQGAHVVRVVVLNPANEAYLPELVAKFGPIQAQGAPERPNFHLVLATFRGMLLPDFGRYQLAIYVDDRRMGELSFYLDPAPFIGPEVVQPGLPGGEE